MTDAAPDSRRMPVQAVLLSNEKDRKTLAFAPDMRNIESRGGAFVMLRFEMTTESALRGRPFKKDKRLRKFPQITTFMIRFPRVGAISGKVHRNVPLFL